MHDILLSKVTLNRGQWQMYVFKSRFLLLQNSSAQNWLKSMVTTSFSQHFKAQQTKIETRNLNPRSAID